MAKLSRLDLGAYEASRAAALSGVPVSTVYHWATNGVVTPSVSPDRRKLWSYGDLLVLRLVRWLRVDKPEAASTTLDEVRAALERFGDDLWPDDQAGRPSIAVSRDGTVIHRHRGETAYGQAVVDDRLLDLFAPYQRGVDLREPATHLRIVPGLVAGEPHVAGSRLTTRSVAALARRGYPLSLIASMYPDEDEQGLAQAISLEEKLAAA